jgi:hypothetical protein
MSDDPILVPPDELIRDHTYYIERSISKPNRLPSTFNDIDVDIPIIGRFAFKSGNNEYMFTHISLTSLCTSYPHFFRSSQYSFYTSVRYMMKDAYRLIRSIRIHSGEQPSFREDLIAYVWEPSRVKRFWITDDYAIFDMMVG